MHNENEKTWKGDFCRHGRITLKPQNPDFNPIVITAAEEGDLHVIPELVEVLASGKMVGKG